MPTDEQYTTRKCYACGGRMLASEYSATVNMRIDGKLHPIGVRRVPCYKCEDCTTATMGEDSDPYFMHYYKKYLDEHGLNTWRHRLYRAVLRQLRLLESWFYRGPLWQWRRQK